MEKLVAAESGFNPFAIGVNGPDRASYAPRSANEAAQIAARLIAEGKSIDMGLGQINSANLSWLGLPMVVCYPLMRQRKPSTSLWMERQRIPKWVLY